MRGTRREYERVGSPRYVSRRKLVEGEDMGGARRVAYDDGPDALDRVGRGATAFLP